jgi:hypothetical protein
MTNRRLIRPIRVTVTGGRDYTDVGVIFGALDFVHFEVGITHLDHGNARGVDRLCGAWAVQNNIPFEPWPADWNGTWPRKAAGNIRNGIMLVGAKPDLLIVFPGGAGTADCSRKAAALGIPRLFVSKYGV